MRKIFLDLGAHIGESVKFFRKHHPQGNEFEVYCFEPLPANIQKLKEIENVTVIGDVAGTVNKMVDLYTGMSESGSVYKEKRTGGLDGIKKVRVYGIDFIEWFFMNTSPDDYIILKMNIEGCEYDIIEEMHLQGFLEDVDKFYVQWHWQKVRINELRHKIAKNMIPEEKLFPWRAMFGDKDTKWFYDSLDK